MDDPFVHSELDSRRFGKRIQRGTVSDDASATRAIALAHGGTVDLLIARCPARGVAVVQRLERDGFFLADTLVYYRGPTGGIRAPEAGSDVEVRDARPDDAPALERIARAAFTGYGGHYHADPRLPPDDCTEGYVEWCMRTTGLPDFDVLVALRGGGLAGFLSLRHASGEPGTPGEPGEPGEIVLNGVAPDHQRRGVYDALVREAGRRLQRRGTAEVVASTQIQNLAPQRVWVRNGLEPAFAFYTLHRWCGGDAPAP